MDDFWGEVIRDCEFSLGCSLLSALLTLREAGCHIYSCPMERGPFGKEPRETFGRPSEELK